MSDSYCNDKQALKHSSYSPDGCSEKETFPYKEADIKAEGNKRSQRDM